VDVALIYGSTTSFNALSNSLPPNILMILWHIWRHFRYERCYSTAGYGFRRFLCNGFPNTRDREIWTHCYTILPWQRILLIVKRFLSNQIVATEYTNVREGVLYPVREICLMGVDLDSQKSVTNSQSVSCQHSRQKRSKDRSETRHRGVRTHCKERL
jgi:hypothetical protein